MSVNSLKNIKLYFYRLAVIGVFFILSSNLNAEIDSLKLELKKLKDDSTTILLLHDIADKYESIDADSALHYYNIALDFAKKNKELSWQYLNLYGTTLRYIGVYHTSRGYYDLGIDYYNQALSVSEQLILFKNIEAVNEGKLTKSMALTNIAGVHFYKADYSLAVAGFSESMDLKNEIGDIKGYTLCINNIGLVYMMQGKYENALQSFQQALSAFTVLADSSNEEISKYAMRGKALVLMNMGVIHRNLKNYHKAIDYYKESTQIRESLNDKRGISDCFFNIGVLYRQLGNSQLAMYYYNQAYELFNLIGDKKGIIRVNNNIGVLLVEQKDFNNALKYYLESHKMATETGDKSALGNIYNNLAIIYINTGEFEKAILYANKAVEISKEISLFPEETRAYNNLMDAWAGKNDYKKAFINAQLYIKAKDSLLNNEKARAIEELELRYETEKKQQEIENQALLLNNKEAEIKVQQSETLRQKAIKNLFILAFVFMFFFALTLYKYYVDKKKANTIINKKNIDLEQANLEISAQNDEIASQRDLLQMQKLKIEKIHKDQTASIKYAKRIQKAIIPSNELLSQIFSDEKNKFDFFALFMARDIVSGDFYWAKRINNKIVFSVADCTGHGVPGAFMSMLGLSFLNEIVSKSGNLTASGVLNDLREKVIEAMQQQVKMFNIACCSQEEKSDFKHLYNASVVKDGMDIALCILDLSTLTLQYAGANNAIYIIKTITKSEVDKDNNNNFNLIELKPDKMPIAIHVKMDSFTNQEIKLNKGDAVYLMSDGFQDQFGGKNNKKFMAKRVKDLLIRSSGLSMNEQKALLVEEYENWKGNNAQLDDVCVLGLKI